MKKTIAVIAVVLFTASFSRIFAQDQPNVGCIDKAVKLQAEDVKRGFINQGMTVYRDAMIGMESQTPFPIEVKLVQGHLYEFLFIGNTDANIKLELYDGEDQNIGTRSLAKGESPGYIIYSFTPAKTDMYLLMLTQKLKHETMCGSFTIMEKQDDNATAPTQQAPPAAATPAQNNGNQIPNSNRYLGH
jgi:hypothetical protein